MKTVTETRYVCEICGTHYANAKDALACENLPANKTGLAVGDRVKSGKTYAVVRGLGVKLVAGKHRELATVSEVIDDGIFKKGEWADCLERIE